MIYIKTDSSNAVFYRDFFPFDSGKTEEELLQTGYLVDSIPEPEPIPGKSPIVKYDGIQFTIEYVDLPPTPESKIDTLEQRINEQDAIIMQLLLGGGAV